MGLIERLKADATCLRGALAHAAHDDAYCAPSDARLPAGHRRARRQIRRRAGAALRPRELQLPGARRAREPLRALGARAGHPQGRHDLPADAEPAGVHGDLARRHPDRRRGGAAQHQSDRDDARALHQCGQATAHHGGGRIARGIRNGARLSHGDGEGLAARRRQGRPSSHRPRGRQPLRRRPDRGRSAARSPSRTARSSSSRRARPACRRPPTSTTTG